MNTLSFSYGEVTTLVLGNDYCIGEDFSMKLDSFSHKRSMVGGPTKASAYILLVKDGNSEEITLSQHGTEGKGADELLEEGYDRSVELIISKREPEL